MRYKLIDKVSVMIQQYSTRKQLNNLPQHLLDDVAISDSQRQEELAKNTALKLLKQFFKEQ